MDIAWVLATVAFFAGCDLMVGALSGLRGEE